MSSIRTILLHLDGSARTPVRTRAADELARAFGATVTAQYFATPSIARYPMALEGAPASVAWMAEYDEKCRQHVKTAFEAQRGGAAHLAWSGQDAGNVGDLCRLALYADLLVLGQPDPRDPAALETPPDMVPLLTIASGKPALVVPYISERPSIGRSVLVAWKPTREAAAAVTAALPLLQHAERVDLACDPEDWSAIAAFLQAHGVKAAHASSGEGDREAGERLLSLAADLSADLLVMGCYGHSRVREWVLGGATRTILQSMTLPVLMAH